MKTTKKIILIIALIISGGCKAQKISLQQQMDNYSSKIVNAWVDEEENSYKLEFLANGTCKEYSGNELLTTYNYSIVSDNCKDFSSENTIYLRLVDLEDPSITCFEILNITDTSLSILIIDRAKRLFFNKQ